MQELWFGAFWHYLIYPEYAEEEIEDPELPAAWALKKVMRGRFPDFVACLSLDDYPQYPPAEQMTLVQKVKACIHACLPPAQRRLLGFAHTNSLYFCGVLPKTKAALMQNLDKLQTEIQQTTSLATTLGVAFLQEKSLPGWRWAAQRAVVAQRAKMRYGSQRLYLYEDDYLASAPALTTYWHLGEQLHHLVQSGNLPQVQATLRETAELLFAKAYLPLGHLQMVLQAQIIFMAHAATEAGVAAEAVTAPLNAFLKKIRTTYEYTGLKALLLEAGEFFAGKVHAQYHDALPRLVAAVEDFLKNRLAEPLSLPLLARSLGVSPSHLSRCFKKEKGISLTAYINQQRVKQAQRLLLDRKLNITEIAFQVGFRNLQHFGRIFKALTGYSPSAYRKKYLAGTLVPSADIAADPAGMKGEGKTR